MPQEQQKWQRALTSKINHGLFFLEEGNRMLYMGVYSILLYFLEEKCIIYEIGCSQEYGNGGNGDYDG